MFEFNPDLVEEDDDEATEGGLQREDYDDDDDEDNTAVVNIDLGMFVLTDIDGTGTRAEEREIETTTEGTVPIMNGISSTGRNEFLSSAISVRYIVLASVRLHPIISNQRVEFH